MARVSGGMKGRVRVAEVDLRRLQALWSGREVVVVVEVV